MHETSPHLRLVPKADCAVAVDKRLGAAPALRVNDVHSELNATHVREIHSPSTCDELIHLVRTARRRGASIAIAGGRHAMGGQQFLTDEMLFDTRNLNKVLHFDATRGLIEVEAGMQWPELIDHLVRAQEGRALQWTIAQKQTGADRLSIGGAVSANVHGRGLTMRPFIGDIESLRIVDADGCVRTCNRNQNADLFKLVVGGYGMFGAIYSVTLRLVHKVYLRRIVEITTTDRVMSDFGTRITSGSVYGDFQFAINQDSDDFLRAGILSTYAPTEYDGEPLATAKLSESDWTGLLHLAHTDKQRAFDRYSQHYLSTDGMLYSSDTFQLASYLDGYHSKLDAHLPHAHRGTEVITEVYVPRDRFAAFMTDARTELRCQRADVIYGTVRLIQQDTESFLPWAKQDYACIVFNLHTEHTLAGVAQSADQFRALIDIAIMHGGNYYLTYHKFATKTQVETCYPQFRQFLALKRHHDPHEVFQSNWYRHYKDMFGV